VQARIELVNMVGSAFTMLKPRFDEEDTHQVAALASSVMHRCQRACDRTAQ
jgi:hypothetical protein